MYEITYLMGMSVDELLAFAKGITNTDLMKTEIGRFYCKEALGWAEYKLDKAKEECNKHAESK